MTTQEVKAAILKEIDALDELGRELHNRHWSKWHPALSAMARAYVEQDRVEYCDCDGDYTCVGCREREAKLREYARVLGIDTDA